VTKQELRNLADVLLVRRAGSTSIAYKAAVEGSAVYVVANQKDVERLDPGKERRYLTVSMFDTLHLRGHSPAPVLFDHFAVMVIVQELLEAKDEVDTLKAELTEAQEDRSFLRDVYKTCSVKLDAYDAKVADLEKERSKLLRKVLSLKAANAKLKKGKGA
jgi:hypothetical protein